MPIHSVKENELKSYFITKQYFYHLDQTSIRSLRVLRGIGHKIENKKWKKQQPTANIIRAAPRSGYMYVLEEVVNLLRAYCSGISGRAAS